MPVGHHCLCRPFHTLFPSKQLLGASLTASPRRLRRVRVRSLSHITTARTPPGTASRHPNSGNRDPVWLPYAVYCNSCPSYVLTAHSLTLFLPRFQCFATKILFASLVVEKRKENINGNLILTMLFVNRFFVLIIFIYSLSSLEVSSFMQCAIYFRS